MHLKHSIGEDMKKSTLLILFITFFLISGCILEIQDVKQPQNVCISQNFNVKVETLLKEIELPQYYDPANIDFVGTAVLMPASWSVIACNVSGVIQGECTMNNEVEQFAEDIFPSSVEMKWFGYGLDLMSSINYDDQINFNLTVLPKTLGSFDIVYFTVPAEKAGNEYIFLEYDNELKSINSIDCSTSIPTLSVGGMIIMSLLFLGTGFFLIRRYKGFSSMNISSIIFIAFIFILTSSAVDAEQRPNLSWAEGAALCELIRNDDGLKHDYFSNIKFFIDDWFNLTEKQKNILMSTSQEDLLIASQTALAGSGYCPKLFIEDLQKRGAWQITAPALLE